MAAHGLIWVVADGTNPLTWHLENFLRVKAGPSLKISTPGAPQRAHADTQRVRLPWKPVTSLGTACAQCRQHTPILAPEGKAGENLSVV